MWKVVYLQRLPIFVPIYYHVVMYIIFTYVEFVTSSASVKKNGAPVKYSRINAKIPLLCFLVNPIRQIRVRARWKNLTFLSYEFGKGQYTFYPVKLSRFLEKNKVRRKYQNFIRGDPYESGQTPLWRTKVSKVKNFFGGFWASKLHESFCIW